MNPDESIICQMYMLSNYPLPNFQADALNDEYLESLANAFPPGPAPLVSVDEVGERVHEAIVAHYHNILRDFESVDYARIGSVTAEDLREVLARHVMRLNDDQVR